MQYIYVGLGNPGEDYRNTRHNTGRIILEMFKKINSFPEWEYDEKSNALLSAGKVGKDNIALVLPETFMNKSGLSIVRFVTSVKKAEGLVVVHDDLDLPLGKFKISFGKHSGGHRGVESIIKQIKTIDFTRVRVGISPVGSKGQAKKPRGDKAVERQILGKYSSKELAILKKTAKSICEGLGMLPKFGLDKTRSMLSA